MCIIGQWSEVHRDIPELKRQIREIYWRDLAPALHGVPGFADQWTKAFHDDKVEHLVDAGESQIRREFREDRLTVIAAADGDRCFACGEKVAPGLVRHLGCE